MKAKSEVRLGQEVFVLSSTGEVVRTMIAEIRLGEMRIKSSYTLLNGGNSFQPHWFTYEEALHAAQDWIKVRAVILRQQLAVDRKKFKRLATDEAREKVMTTPYRVVNFNSHDEGSRRTRSLKKVVIPDKYPEPGTVVYVLITPKIKPLQFEYRPFPYFVLETVVTRVSFSPDGKVQLSFKTPFSVDEYFLSRKEAISALKNYPEVGKVERTHFVSSAREKAEIDKIEDIPF